MTIFDEQISRKPNLYPWTNDFIEAIQNGFWTHREFSFGSDVHNFKVDLTEQEREMVTRTLSAIGQIEIAVKTFWAKLGDNLPHPSLSDMGMVFSANEVVHNHAYFFLLERLDLDSVFEENLKLEWIQGRVNYLRKYTKKVYDDDKKQYLYALILFTLFVENVSLFSQFYVINWLNRNKNVLKDTQQQINYTKKEEECFSSDTEVMTPSGWRMMKDMKVGDEVFQYNADQTISLTKVMNTTSKKYNGELYTFYSVDKEHYCEVTPNHDMVLIDPSSNSVIKVKAKDVLDKSLEKDFFLPAIKLKDFNEPDLFIVNQKSFFVKKNNYKGFVYCISVPSGMIITRLKGGTFITGNCHALAGTKIINTIRKELPELFDKELEDRVANEALEAFNAESKIIDWMVNGYNEDGLSAPVLKEFVKLRINESLEQIQFAPIFSLDKDLVEKTDWFYEELHGNSATDFFHSRPVEYSRNTSTFDEESLF